MKKVKTINIQVENLLSEVVDADIPHELKRFIINRLEQIRSAILFYKINGVEGLKDALEATIGAAYLFQVEYNEEDFESESNRSKDIIQGFNKVASSLYKVVAFAYYSTRLMGIEIPPLLGS